MPSLLHYDFATHQGIFRRERKEAEAVKVDRGARGGMAFYDDGTQSNAFLVGHPGTRSNIKLAKT